MNVALGILLGIVQFLLLYALGAVPLLAVPICYLTGAVSFPALALRGHSPAASGRGMVSTLLAVLLQTMLMVVLGGLVLRAVDAADAAWGLGTILSVAWRVTLFLPMMAVLGQVRQIARADPTEGNIVTLWSLGLTQYTVPLTYLAMAIWPELNPMRLVL